MGDRSAVPAGIAAEILTACRRRCCLCAALRGDLAEKKGQIAHLDHEPANNRPDNLAFLCLEHHDGYDSRSSQSKGLTPREVKAYQVALLEEIAGGALGAQTASAPTAPHHVEAAVYLGPGAIHISGSGAVQISGPDAINIIGSVESGPPGSGMPPQETLVEQAARFHREQEEDQARLALLVSQGREMAAREAVKALDTMVEFANATGVTVERRGRESRGCFHFGGLTVGVQWHPSEYINFVPDARLGVTLWGAHYALAPSVYLKPPPELRTITYQFDVAPQTHDPVWRPDRKVDQPLSTRALAEGAIRLLFDQVEKARKRP